MKKTTGKKIHSVLVDDLQHCIVTGSPEVAMHHVFNGPCRSLSDRYGFIVPLRPDWHNMTRTSAPENSLLPSLARVIYNGTTAAGLVHSNP